MSDLAERLERLGLSEYSERLAAEGFDTWETVLDITESDLNTLGVKLGHRRKLQRAIAESRGQPTDRALLLEHGKVATSESGFQTDDESAVDAKDSSGQITPAPTASAPSTGTKRKYRRHPKADENAPERPPSAYVIFSNQVREELKGQELSFTEIAKLVGERWQVLAPAVREAFEKQAASAKEKYYSQMAEYKKTPQYQEYQQYLADFKAKHATPRGEGKRSKTQIEAAGDSFTRAPSQDKTFGGPSPMDTQAPSHHRTESLTGGLRLGLAGGYPASSTTSPAQASVGLQSPITQHAYSPHSSPPPASSIYSSSYDLPHHARASDPRAKEYFAPANPRPWQQSPRDSTTSQSPMGSDFFSRRSTRASDSLPSLIRQDTSTSSHGESLPPPNPYQSHVLPPLDAPKSERILPHPLPSITAAPLIPSPLDMRTPVPHSGPTPVGPTTGPSLGAPPLPTPPVSNPPTSLEHPASRLDALIRASEMLQDTDMKDDNTRR